LTGVHDLVVGEVIWDEVVVRLLGGNIAKNNPTFSYDRKQREVLATSTRTRS
jgi:hypothetical protein